MLDEGGKLVLCDFGVSEFLAPNDDTVQGLFGTVRFMAPEMFGTPAERENMHAKSIDIWAAGVTLYKLLTNQYPFPGKSVSKLREQLKNPPPFETIENIEQRQLLSRMLERSPGKRS